MKDGHFSKYWKPAACWQEALPIGSGDIGVMVFGGVKKERLALNHDEIWGGGPGMDTGYAGSKKFDYPRAEFLKEARKLVLEGKNDEAQDLLEKDFQGEDSQAYLPLGDLFLEFSGEEGTENYVRTLDFQTALAEVAYTQNGKKVSRTAFASHPAGVVVYRIDAEEHFDLSISMTSPLRYKTEARETRLAMTAEAPSYTDRRDPNPFYRYLDDDAHRGIQIYAALEVKTDGYPKAMGDKLCVRGANRVELYFSTATSFAGPDKHPFLEGKDPKPIVNRRLLSALQKGYDVLKEEHVADHRSFYDRVELDLGSDGKENESTYDRLLNFMQDKKDIGLYTLLFNFGRYLLIASSRAGTQPTNLQGIWNDEPNPPWNSNYTTNINTEMNYWPALPTAMPELTEPHNRMVDELRENGSKTARQYYGAGGFTVHHNSDLWRHTVPVQGQAVWSFWPMASGWLCRHLYEYYEYTLDLDFLRDKAYPVMADAARFYLDVLSDDGEGKLALVPSTSPENNFWFNGKATSVSKTTTMTMTIIRELFLNLLETEKLLGLNRYTPEIEAVLPKLWQPKIGSRGQLLEWAEEMEEVEPHHRHTSHLYGLYPAGLFNEEDTPEYFAACKRTLEERGDDGTGWSLGWKINFWARLNDGDHAKIMLDNQLRLKDPMIAAGSNLPAAAILAYNGGGTYANLFDAHPPFQIDGNFGCTAGIAEMLVRSIGKKITLLPALPTDWKTGSLKGIAVKGNMKLDICWKDGILESYRIHGDQKDYEIWYKGKRLA
ncbi:MAG: glycoside hydrolase family 95 protein [Clostridia bacterium]|nr:glycoside hydrolase family 95 protein [Clostridia bacterium]